MFGLKVGLRGPKMVGQKSGWKRLGKFGLREPGMVCGTSGDPGR